MKKIFSTLKMALPMSLFVMILTSSCNKELPQAIPNEVVVPTGSTIGDVLNTNPDFSILKAAVIKSGLMEAVSNKSNVFTVFAPNDEAFIASGVPLPVIEYLPAQVVASIIQYHIIPGQKVTSAAIPTTFPNVQMVTSFVIPAPNTNPLVRFSSFPSKRGSQLWLNNIPVIASDVATANGVIHVVARVVAPPSRVLLDTMARDADMQYLVAAILTADAGVPEGSRFQDYLANPLANFTIFAPSNQAFMNLLAYNSLPIDPSSLQYLDNPKGTLGAIIANHILLNRAFAANLPSDETVLPSFLAAIAPPGVGLLTVSSAGVKGAGNPTFSNITAIDRHAINGVYHIIDQLLLPQ